MGIADRKLKVMDKDGRVTIPKAMRKALGLPLDQEYPITIHAVPSMEDCKRLVITK